MSGVIASLMADPQYPAGRRLEIYRAVSRAERSLTQSELAEALGVRPWSVSRWEQWRTDGKDHGPPGGANRARIANLIGIPADHWELIA